MNETLPIIYLSGIVIFLGGLGIFLLFQIIKTRRIENRFYKLQKKLQKEKGTAKDYYELGSLYLDKKMYVQAVGLLQKGFKTGGKIEPENKALMCNALGFAYFSQEQLDVAIRHYKDAIKLYPDYVIALNNLANAYERKQMIPQAIETYEESLKYEPDNKTAKNRIESLRKRLVKSN
ncbi:tetratricopeptide repeat protein [Crocosphaera sp. UHCC 0190]|uniref:tetratricopeptide repeat protein n=1 Tax=Crocosphaera sp. UHCC 0190 TaxID=3110246 RepID=UPI002B210143|nr:tetratricopeptide repeat protein [Crocosphaera sp. UHCC 0190]MEA5509072.1 tetratricopeptide repeat protein [Crocosphaera sp. UHCC 0190]